MEPDGPPLRIPALTEWGKTNLSQGQRLPDPRLRGRQIRRGVLPMIKYNVVCQSCNTVFQPTQGSPAWWIAKKRAEAGYLDAAYVQPKHCGCTPEFVQTSPFVICGYDMDGSKFRYCVPTFVAAVKALRQHRYDVVFATGLSGAVLTRLGCR